MVTPLDCFAQVDSVLQPWARRHGLHIYTRAQDEDVRVVSVVDDAGDIYHIGITPAHHEVAVEAALSQKADAHTSSRERRKFLFRRVVPSDQVGPALEAAWERVRSWIERAGHTHTVA